jgi:hypothetical protein
MSEVDTDLESVSLGTIIGTGIVHVLTPRLT